MNLTAPSALATASELLAEASFSDLLRLLTSKEYLGLCVRDSAKVNTSQTGLSLKLNNVAMYMAWSEQRGGLDRLETLHCLVQQARSGKFKILHRNEITASICAIRSLDPIKDIGTSVVYAVAAQANDDWSPPVRAPSAVRKIFGESGSLAKRRVTLAADSFDFKRPLLEVEGKYFEIMFTRVCNSTRATFGDEIMETSGLTVKAIIGSIQVPIEDLLRLRSGSTFNLGNTSSLEAIFEVEGAPFATGRVIITEEGELQIETKEFL